MTDWSAVRYMRFAAERTRPSRDLLAAVPDPVRRAVDIGCGPGNSTEALLARFPDAKVTGLDNSPDMIAAARSRLPGVDFQLAEVADWANSAEAGALDLILANAVLQWLPDHQTLFPRLLALVAPGGALAVQMPDNLDEPSHRLMREVAADGPWSAKLAGAAGARAPRHSADWYYALLRPGAVRLDIWRTTYFHVLAGAEAVVDWVKETGLRPFLAPLTEAEREDYLSRYRAGVAKAYPALPDGTLLLPFPRLFIVATAAGR